jgi:hypothetical protein
LSIPKRDYQAQHRFSERVGRYDPGMADLNRLAARIVQESTEDGPAETPAQASGRKGGRQGGKARAEKLTAERRSEIARKAAAKRWDR